MVGAERLEEPLMAVREEVQRLVGPAHVREHTAEDAFGVQGEPVVRAVRLAPGLECGAQVRLRLGGPAG